MFIKINNVFLIRTYLFSHEIMTSPLTQTKGPFQEGKNSLTGIHISPVHIALEK